MSWLSIRERYAGLHVLARLSRELRGTASNDADVRVPLAPAGDVLPFLRDSSSFGGESEELVGRLLI
jgi:hypothetical protein